MLRNLFSTVHLPWILFFAMAWLLVSCSNTSLEMQAPYKQTNVILISIDTCRTDFLTPYGTDKLDTPALQDFADDAIVFTNAVTPVPLTVPAHSTLLTGLHPVQHGVRDNFNTTLGNTVTTLAELFRESGYHTAGVIGAILLSRQNGFAQGFDHFDDEFDAEAFQQVQPVVERKAEEVFTRSVEWLRSHLETQSDQPFFLFSHFYDPHMRYTPPQKYRDRFLQQPYAGEIAYVDDTLDKYFHFLKQQDIYEDSIIVVVGDHGEGLGDHGESTHGLLLYEEVMHVPFLVKLPNSSGRSKLRIDQLVGLQDVTPTLIDLCGLGPVQSAGMSLQPWLLGSAEPVDRQLVLETQYPYTYNWSPLFALREPEWKYIQAPKSELYNLAQDPEESINLVDQESSRAQQMKADLENRLLELSKINIETPDEQALTADRAEALAALGYAAGGGATADLDEQEHLPDPKDRLEIYNRIDQGLLFLATEQYPQAYNLFHQVVQDDPNNPSAYFNLGLASFHMRRWNEARNNAQLAIEKSPTQAVFARMLLAKTYIATGEYQISEEKLGKIVEEFPKLADAHYWLGVSNNYAGNHQQALQHFEDAKRIMPDMPQLQEAIANTKAQLNR